ncbi:MAG: ACP phosphodiesterase [Gemmatimonadales bacterium]|nr:ACP phosphodiesterase [Gemmatimonadales bacterium]
MNLLHHHLLAEPDAEHRLGAIVADVVRGRAREGLGARVREGIAHHEAVDRFTDAHPAVQASRARVGAPWRRYAGVVIDVYYGHCLACRWGAQAPGTFDAYVRDAYAGVTPLVPTLPEPAATFAGRLVRFDWLGAYASVEGTASLLAGMSRRLAARFGRPVAMEDAIPGLVAQHDALLGEFDRFAREAAAALAGGRGPHLLSPTPPRDHPP